MGFSSPVQSLSCQAIYLMACAQAVAAYFCKDLSHFATQAVGNIMWGSAVLNFYDQDMFNTAALEIQRACCFAPLSCKPVTKHMLFLMGKGQCCGQLPSDM